MRIKWSMTCKKKGGRLYEALREAFGNQILKADGELDRTKLSEMLFSNPDNMATSSAIQNQIIKEELAAKRDHLAQSQAIFFHGYSPFNGIGLPRLV